MSLSTAVLRAVPGAFILNSGIGKLGMPAEMAEALQGMAVKGVPPLAKMTPEQFAKFLSYGEIAVGATLLLPFVPTKVAGAGLAVFSGSMMAMYLRTPEMTESDGVRPSQEGTALAKDSWLLAIASALILAQGKKSADD
ncbi:DoxX family membrane protein [Brachybacterium sacelli]|uniref:Membrane protein YphA (DoxX/SURF4 family) n=1 Tax=Brachybacterium sacelli TaxID=173364 RepID=A0ABS4WWI5_9MICO|nr:DoxX family membrane protein [Brachybacterium sacelli]MBP2380572.1 putative membrane protein YphA (DoxX/SURF4 family) [Brachybacterium sacelli]